MYIRVIQSVTNETNYSKLFLVQKIRSGWFQKKYLMTLIGLIGFFFYIKKKRKLLTRLPGKKRRVIIYLGVREI